MKNKNAKSSKKRIRQSAVLIVIVFLMLINLGMAIIGTLFDRVLYIDSLIVSRVENLRSSIIQADEQTKNLTATYDGWYLRRLEFLDNVWEKEQSGYDRIIPLVQEFFTEADVTLCDRTNGTTIGHAGEAATPGEISEILEHLGEEETLVYETLGYRWYIRSLDEAVTVLWKTNTGLYYEVLNNIYTPDEILSRNMLDGDNYYFTAVDGIITIHPDYDYTNHPVDEYLKKESNSFETLNTILQMSWFDGESVFSVKTEIEEMGMDLYYVIPSDSIMKQTRTIVYPLIIAMLLLLIIYAEYLFFLRIDLKNRSSEGVTRQNVRYKGVTLAVICLLAMLGITYYARTLYGLSEFVENYKDLFETVQYSIDDSALCINDLQEDFDHQRQIDAGMIAKYLSRYPERRTSDELAELSDTFALDYIMMFNLDGKETLTDSNYIGYSIVDDPQDPSSVFTPLKRGVPVITAAPAINPLSGKEDQIIGVTTKDQEGHVDGFLQTVYTTEPLRQAQASSSLINIFDNSVISNVFSTFLIDNETKTVLYDRFHDSIGKTAEEVGFTEESLRSGSSGYLTLDTIAFYGACQLIGKNNLFVGISTDSVFRFRMIYTFWIVLFFFLDLIIITMLELRVTVPVYEKKLEEKPEAGSGITESLVYVQRRDAAFRALPMRERLKHYQEHWLQMTAEEKIGRINLNFALLTAGIVSFLILFRERLFGRESMLSYIMERTWPRGINVFSVSAIILLVIMVLVAVMILRAVLKLLASVLTARAETVCHLIRSCIEYGSAIATAYMAFGFLGVDVVALSATVGFLSLIIGFGAKSLITDIVAGIFIIYEQEFQVGDIVEINGYRGMVKEIGLRTTKLVSWDKNIKIINNHDISSVVNMTMCNSYATVNFTMPVTISIEELEKIFREELPKLPKKYPEIIGMPTFAGVLSFSGSRMKCRISAEVEELKRGDMENNLHCEVQEILERHNIPLK